jgi:hypothetical protein
MVTIILAVALLIALTGLGVEIGITSWNIRRANRYQCRKPSTEYITEQAIDARCGIARRVEFLDDYVSKISWVLNLLYNRYNKFDDIEKEIENGLVGVTLDTPIGEADDGYRDLEEALQLIKGTIKAF